MGELREAPVVTEIMGFRVPLGDQASSVTRGYRVTLASRADPVSMVMQDRQEFQEAAVRKVTTVGDRPGASPVYKDRTATPARTAKPAS